MLAGIGRLRSVTLDCWGRNRVTFPAGILAVAPVCVWCARDGPHRARGGNGSVFGRRLRDVLLKDATLLRFSTYKTTTSPGDKLLKTLDFTHSELLFESPDLRTLMTAQLLLVAETKQPTGTVIPSAPPILFPTLSPPAPAPLLFHVC